MPGPLIPGDSHNPEGYFERSDITALQEQLLIDLERWWPSPRGMQALPEGWLSDPIGQQALSALSELLWEEQQRQQGPWAIKDPRSSLLLPLWRAACTQVGIPLRLLLAVRDPSEVVVSLVRRDQAYTGMDAWRAQRLWWHHNTQVLRDGNELPLQVVSYGHWFNPNAAAQQLNHLVPGHSQEQQLVALAAVKPQHRRSQKSTAAGPIHPSLQRLHQRLEQAALQPERISGLQQWVGQQKPLPTCRHRFRDSLLRLVGGSTEQRIGGHPWRYLAELRVGSNPSSVHSTIQRWLKEGFSAEELNHAAALPSTTPQATADQIQRWQQTEAGIENTADVEPGLDNAARLLALASQPQVLDSNRQRVGLLRQFGVSAFWLPT